MGVGLQRKEGRKLMFLSAYHASDILSYVTYVPPSPHFAFLPYSDHFLVVTTSASLVQVS